MLFARLIDALTVSRDGAADAVLLEALAVGREPEQAVALETLIKRGTLEGLVGVVRRFASLPPALQQRVIELGRAMSPALLASSRDDDRENKIAALQLIASMRQGRLCHVLSENLHGGDDAVATAAAAALYDLSEWTAARSRPGVASDNDREFFATRHEIEQTVARALDLHRGRHGQTLLKAAILLANHGQSKTLGILTSVRHSGQAMMQRRLQQPPEAQSADAMLLAATQSHVRVHFAAALARAEKPDALAALLHRTHLLREPRIAAAVRTAQRGAWFEHDTLAQELPRRTSDERAKIIDWLTASGLVAGVIEQRLQQLREHDPADAHVNARLARRLTTPGETPAPGVLRKLLDSDDPAVQRVAARALGRLGESQQPAMMTRLATVSPDARPVLVRVLGGGAFESFWLRFESMPKPQRKAAGRALFKLLPESDASLVRMLKSSSAAEVVRALQMVCELKRADEHAEAIASLLDHTNAKVRSKAVALLREIPAAASDAALERAATDADPRVRANAIEVIEARGGESFVPTLAARARGGSNRERANAIKALSKLRVGAAASELLAMLDDPRGEHRISALWALREIGWWRLVKQVADLAKSDNDQRVRRYAAAVLKSAVESLRPAETRKAG